MHLPKTRQCPPSADKAHRDSVLHRPGLRFIAVASSCSKRTAERSSRYVQQTACRLLGIPTIDFQIARCPASAVPESSCPPGTVLKNLSFVKDAADPVALEDDKYPAWVWTLAESARKAPKEGADEAANLRNQRKALKAERKVSMKAANALKG